MIKDKDKKIVWNYLVPAVLTRETQAQVEFDGACFLVDGVKFHIFNKEAGMLVSDDDDICHLPSEVVAQMVEAAAASELFGELGDGLHFDANLKVATFVSLASARKFGKAYPSWTAESHNGQIP